MDRGYGKSAASEVSVIANKDTEVMHMKRKMLCFLLALGTLLSAAASAADMGVAELRATLPDRWQQSYTAHGREIMVNVAIETSDTQNFPVLTVRKPVEKTPEAALKKFTKLHANQPGHIGGFTGKEIANVADAGTVKQKQWEVYQGGDIPTVLPEDNSIAYEHALQTVTGIIFDLTGLTYQKEFTLKEVHVRGRYYQYAHKKGEDHFGKPRTDIGYYDFYFEPCYYGIPCPTNGYTGYMAVSYANDERLYMVLQWDDAPSVVFEDVPLCSFSEVQKVLEAEIEKGLLRSVEKVELCYVPYRDPKDASLFWLLPTWKILGLYAENAKIVPLKFMENGWGFTSDAIAAIEYAADLRSEEHTLNSSH